MADFPVDLTNAVDGEPGVGTPIQAKHLNNVEAKIGANQSAVVTSLDYLLKNAASIDPGHKHNLYIAHDLATAANDFLVASGSGVFAKQTLAQAKTTLGLGLLKIADVSLSADASKTISSALEAGKKYKLLFTLSQNTTAGYLYCNMNNDVGANYYFSQFVSGLGASADGGANAAGSLLLTYYKSPTTHLMAAGTYAIFEMTLHCVPSSHTTILLWSGTYNPTAIYNITGGGGYAGAADLNRLDIGTSAGTLTGTVTLYELL